MCCGISVTACSLNRPWGNLLRVGQSSVRVVVSANSLWNIKNFRSALIGGLEQAGYCVEVAAPVAHHALATVRPIPWPVHSLRFRSDGVNPTSDLRLAADYLRLLRRVRPVAFLSFTAKPNIYGGIACAILGIPAFPNVSGLGTAFIRGGLLRAIVSSLYRAAFRKAPVVFFQNGEDRALFVERRIVTPEQAVVLPGSGVDLDRFRAAGRPVVDGTGASFLFVGRMLGDKGVRELAEAARILRRRRSDIRVRLVGFAGAENRTAIRDEELRDWQDEGIVEYLGPTDDVRPFIADADAVVLPSYREGMPRALLEAAAMARPLIASDVPGCREIVRHGENGLLFEVRSPQSLAEAMERFADMAAGERASMGEAARRLVEEEFSEQKVIAMYLDALAKFSSRESKS